MASPTVLKAKHSLIGKSLIPIFLRVKAADEEVEDLARLKKEHPLENYTADELHAEFEKITGESMKDVIPLTGKQENILTARTIMHFAILQANLVGGPKGQYLHTPAEGQGPSQSAPTGGTNLRTQSTNNPQASTSTDGVNQKKSELEDRVASIESNLQDINSRKLDSQEFILEQQKKLKFLPDIPGWEVDTGFCPNLIPSREVKWVNYRGETLEPSTIATAEEVADGSSFSLDNLSFRDHDNFISGNLHNFLGEWSALNPPTNVLSWLKEGVKVDEFFKPFKGNFRGKSYNSNTPPSMYLPNAKNCSQFGPFIAQTLLERICNGSISVLGKVGECQPPHLVLPLTVEPSKPRLCHDERFLNLWIIDCPFQLDTLREVPRIIHKNSYMVSLDDKSSYDHLLLHPSSRTFFGIQFAGWFLVFNVIPFGFKGSAYIYHTTGLVPISYCRQLGVPCLLYIDDRLLSEFLLKGNQIITGDKSSALKSLYIVCQILVRLGYFLNLSKCIFIPTQVIRFLGLITDSMKLAFILPDDKRAKFALLRDFILSEDEVSVKTLQRFAGKCISFFLSIPSAKLYSKEVNRAIGLASKNSKRISISGSLKEEIAHWKFLDEWSGCASWKNEKHLQITLASDASEYKWGALIWEGNAKEACGDFWKENDHRPIHLKEASALLNALTSYKHIIRDHRVDVYVDNLPLLHAWEGQKGKDPELNDVMKKTFTLTEECNFTLKLLYVPSANNPADAASRSISFSDSTLSFQKWLLVEERFGPHSTDLMALDSNAMLDVTLQPLRHFTPFPTPGSAGVNIFSQDIAKEPNPYVFPPFGLVLPVLKFLSDQKVERCTIVVPDFSVKAIWWPFFWAHVIDWFCLAKVEELGAILYPSKLGFTADKRGLRWSLIAARLGFS